MKGNKKILALALLLFLITAVFTTYAIYKSSQSATGSISAAAWSISFEQGGSPMTANQTLTFTSADCSNNHVADGKIAPGATCTKEITIDATGSEVDVIVSGTVGDVTASKGGNAVETTNANDFNVSFVTNPANGIITMDSLTHKATVTVTVEWEGDEDNTKDPADTALNGATLSVPITLIAKQYLGS